MTRRTAAAIAIAASTLAVSCGGDASDRGLVFFPSSFAEVGAEVEASLQNAGEPAPEIVLAASSRHVAQLLDGAPAAVLITADAETMQRAIDGGAIKEELGIVALNRLVLAVAPGNPGSVAAVEDLGDDELLIGVCAPEVPCGRLALEASEALDLELAPDTEEPNARSLTSKLAQGELHAGLIYATDALAFGLETVDDDRLASFTTEYPAARVGDGSTAAVDYLLSPEGQELLVSMGFSVP